MGSKPLIPAIHVSSGIQFLLIIGLKRHLTGMRVEGRPMVEIVQGLLGLESILLARGKAVNYHVQSVNSLKKVCIVYGGAI